MQKEVLDNHVKFVHEKIKDFKWAQCNLVTQCRRELDDHIRIKHDEKQDFSCEHSDQKAQSSEILKDHIRNVHENKNEDNVLNIQYMMESLVMGAI